MDVEKIIKWSILGMFVLFFVMILLGVGYYIVRVAGNAPISITMTVLVLSIIALLIGFIMLFRAARMISGDATRLSNPFFSTEDTVSFPEPESLETSVEGSEQDVSDGSEDGSNSTSGTNNNS